MAYYKNFQKNTIENIIEYKQAPKCKITLFSIIFIIFFNRKTKKKCNCSDIK